MECRRLVPPLHKHTSMPFAASVLFTFEQRDPQRASGVAGRLLSGASRRHGFLGLMDVREEAMSGAGREDPAAEQAKNAWKKAIERTRGPQGEESGWARHATGSVQVRRATPDSGEGPCLIVAAVPSWGVHPTGAFDAEWQGKVFSALKKAVGGALVDFGGFFPADDWPSRVARSHWFETVMPDLPATYRATLRGELIEAIAHAEAQALAREVERAQRKIVLSTDGKGSAEGPDSTCGSFGGESQKRTPIARRAPRAL